jgi:putative ABC transport system permease protein
MFGMLDASRNQQAGVGGDMIVRPGASNALISTSAASADVRIADVLRKLPHVEVVSPVNVKLNTAGSVENIFGIDFQSYNALRPFVFKAGGPFQHPFDIIVDDLQAASGKGIHIGDAVSVLNHTFHVCGIVEHGKGARKFIPLTTMDALDGNPNKAAIFYIRTQSVPKFQQDVRHEVLSTPGLENWSVQTTEELISQLTPERMPGFNVALRVVISIAVVIGFLVIFQSMYTAVMERTREIGILKSLGASRSGIVSVVLRETGLLAVTGVLVGVSATYLLRALLHGRFPTLSFELTPHWVAYAVVIALCGALFGALYPAFKAARKDPIDALSYE